MTSGFKQMWPKNIFFVDPFKNTFKKGELNIQINKRQNDTSKFRAQKSSCSQV